MVSLLQRLLVIGWLALFFTAAYQVVAGRGSWAAAFILALLTTGHAIVLAAEFVVMAAVNRRAGIGSEPCRGRLQAWAAEVMLAVRVFAFRQPFASRKWPDVPARRGQRGVVLVHGFMCNRGLWNGWMARLHRLGVPYAAVDLEPPWGPIERYASIIDVAVARLTAESGLPPVMVAHSMGGLAARHWWQATAVDRIQVLITLGTPHRGTWLARFGHLPNVRQMRPDASWLTPLNTAEGPERRARTICFYSPCDHIVFPPTHAVLDGADNRPLPGMAHLQMLSHPAPWTELLAQLQQTGDGDLAAGGHHRRPPLQ